MVRNTQFEISIITILSSVNYIQIIIQLFQFATLKRHTLFTVIPTSIPPKLGDYLSTFCFFYFAHVTDFINHIS